MPEHQQGTPRRMASWFSKIDPRNRKTARPPAAPATWELTCDCGERLVGFRTPQHQQVVCTRCGERLFVLPANVYPEPPPAPRAAVETIPAPEPDERASGEPDTADSQAALTDGGDGQDTENDNSARRSSGTAGGDDPLAQLSAESRRSTRKTKQARRQGKPDSEPARKVAPAGNPAAVPAPADTTPPPVVFRDPLGTRIRRRLRRTFSPFRLIVVAMLCLVSVTVWWQVNQRREETARVDYELARKKAFDALAQNDFGAARPWLAKAAAAADLAGREDTVAQRVRRLSLETEVLNQLSATSLFQAVSTATLAPPGDMAAALLNRLGDRWIVLDTWVTPGTVTPAGRVYSIDTPLLVNDTLVQATVTGGEFDVLDLPSAGYQVVFAGQVTSCDLVRSGGGDPNRLVLGFDSDSIRLWASPETYRAAGFVIDDEDAGQTDDILLHQARKLGAAE